MSAVVPQQTVEDTLWQAFEYFVHKDVMNAAVHGGVPRYSPITFRLAEHLHEMEVYPHLLKRNGEILSSVVGAIGRYEEDKGR